MIPLGVLRVLGALVVNHPSQSSVLSPPRDTLAAPPAGRSRRREGGSVGLRAEGAEAVERAGTRPSPGALASIARAGRWIAGLAWWWHVVAVAVIAAALIGAAYQGHPAYDIAIGQRVQDDPLVTG